VEDRNLVDLLRLTALDRREGWQRGDRLRNGIAQG
jgi:hypothetical protein